MGGWRVKGGGVDGGTDCITGCWKHTCTHTHARPRVHGHLLNADPFSLRLPLSFSLPPSLTHTYTCSVTLLSSRNVSEVPKHSILGDLFHPGSIGE